MTQQDVEEIVLSILAAVAIEEDDARMSRRIDESLCKTPFEIAVARVRKAVRNGESV